MQKIILIILALVFQFSFLNAQNVLKLEDAIKIGLKNNYDIQISKNSAEISKTNNTKGAAGMNPNVNLNMGGTVAFDSYKQEFLSAPTASGSNANIKNYNAGIALSWTLFDGYKMFITKEKLEETEKLGDLSYRSQVQQTVFQIISAYYDIVRQKQQLNTILELKASSAERMKLGETRFNAGLSSKVELLQAQIDFNTQSQNEIVQINAIAETKRNLNQIINNELLANFEVEEIIPINTIDSAGAESKILDNNPTIQSLQKSLDIASLSIKEYNALNYPTINLSANYGATITENSISSTTYSRYLGPTIGATFSLPIFQGGNITRQMETAELNKESINLQLSAQKTKAKAQYETAFHQYKTQSELLEIEKKTKDFAKENLFLAMERLKLSQTTSLEVRDAELSYQNSLTRFSNIAYSLKLAEIQIKLLMGEL